MKQGVAKQAPDCPLLALADRLAAHAALKAAALEVRAGRSVSFEPVFGGARAVSLSAFEQHWQAVVLVVLPTLADLERLDDELPLFSRIAIEQFPPWEVEPHARTPADPVFGQRQRTLKSLIRPTGPLFILTTVTAIQQPVPSKSAVAGAIQELVLGGQYELEPLRRSLLEIGYQHVTAVSAPGELSCLGGIWDVFAADAEYPVRIEWFGDTVESLRQFDVTTQRTVRRIERYAIGSAQVSGGQVPQATFFEYLSEDVVVVLVEPQAIWQEAKSFYEQRAGVEPLQRAEEVFAQLNRLPQVELVAIGSGAATRVRLPLLTVERFSGEVGRVAEELDRAVQDHHVWLVVETQAEQARLRELFGSTQLMREGRLEFVIGRLHQGFRLVSERTIVLSGVDLFQRSQLRRPSVMRTAGRAVDAYTDLKPGDLVVHVSHGIGRYRGMELVERAGGKEEHLVIEFADQVRVSVPSSRIYLVHKYVGGTQRRPRLASLRSKSWARKKQAAQRAVMSVAMEMLELQARRLTHPGHACGPDSNWQHEFDAAFPYSETPDQIEAIAAIKRDMECTRPMDRLLCGDVGFGKTELAMRAAFKAVDNGYQVAFMAPTTVLVEQHYQTFRERMAEFPITIAKLSRFCTKAEERSVVEGLARGSVDIVIGTHRLASGDLKFRNLGLVIIDEEQRFGVRKKEYLKSLRANVDVLTLTATPIPRTLHMALVGVRDISNLQTPPHDRQEVETVLISWNDEVIRHATLRELSRHGQIYFVHNRIKDIHEVADKLRSLVPEARLEVAHAKLPEDELEQVMVDFVQHRFDILVSTNIVENGLDIPNANTIFIDEAERFGLADLHQLRGRVGRYKHKAYCYLLLSPNGPFTVNAYRRLMAIAELQHLGAGFSIAMRDLEIRGAGNLLGVEQSGHIAAVGYELYCQLLENAVRTLKQLPPKSVCDVEIRLPLDAYLPESYVPDARSRIELYRRLAGVRTEQEIEEIADELRDRFGPWPAPVEGLFRMARLRYWASYWAINAVYLEDHALVLRYTDRGRLLEWRNKQRTPVRLVDEDLAYLPLDNQHLLDGQVFTWAETLLQP